MCVHPGVVQYVPSRGLVRGADAFSDSTICSLCFAGRMNEKRAHLIGVVVGSAAFQCAALFRSTAQVLHGKVSLLELRATTQLSWWNAPLVGSAFILIPTANQAAHLYGQASVLAYSSREKHFCAFVLRLVASGFDCTMEG